MNSKYSWGQIESLVIKVEFCGLNPVLDKCQVFIGCIISKLYWFRKREKHEEFLKENTGSDHKVKESRSFLLLAKGQMKGKDLIKQTKHVIVSV